MRFDLNLHAASFWIWGTSVLMLMIPGLAGLAVMVWLGSLALWLAMRQQRQTLQQPNAWQRYYDPNRTSPATVTPPAITVAPNWFPDPRGEKRLRYWDGQQWTEHTTE